MEKTEILICSCNSTEHQIVIYKDEEDEKPFEKLAYVHIHLTKRSFKRRIIPAIKYLFGYRCKYGEWDEILLDKDHVSQLEELIKYLKDNDK